MALTYNLRPGYRVAQIDRTRFYIVNDAFPEYLSQTYFSHEKAQKEARRLNAGQA